MRYHLPQGTAALLIVPDCISLTTSAGEHKTRSSPILGSFIKIHEGYWTCDSSVDIRISYAVWMMKELVFDPWQYTENFFLHNAQTRCSTPLSNGYLGVPSCEQRDRNVKLIIHLH
jgi:hypothetical protein